MVNVNLKINPYIDNICRMYNVERTKGIDSIVEYMVKHMVLIVDGYGCDNDSVESSQYIIERIRERTGVY